MNRKKIMVLTDWFFPGYRAGGPIQSCLNFSLAMKDAYELYIVTTDTDLGEKEPYPQIDSDRWTSTIDEHIHVFYCSRPKLTYKTLLEIISGAQPDFVYLNHMFSTYFVIMPMWMWWRGKVKAKLILCPRGALFHSALHYKNKFIKKIIFVKLLRWLGVYKKIRFHATNDREAASIRDYFPSDNITVANNLPNNVQTSLETIVKTPGQLCIIFVSRIVPIKNLLYVLNVLPRINGRVTFTIIGPVEDALYWEACQKKIKELLKNVVINYVGSVQNAELHHWIKKSHLFVLPTEGENFGHAIFEAFLAGRPVLISDQTPWSHLAEKKVGWDLPLSRPGEFVAALQQAAEWSQEEFEMLAMNSWRFAAAYNQTSDEKKKYVTLFS